MARIAQIGKECPFCGNQPAWLDYTAGTYRVKCPRCGARTGEYGKEREAVEAWQRRAGENAECRKQNEELKG